MIALFFVELLKIISAAGKNDLPLRSPNRAKVHFYETRAGLSLREMIDSPIPT